MNDYRRFVSYIYAYPNGVRDKNVGFCKAEVRQGHFRLNVNLKGVYTDTPELYTVYMLIHEADISSAHSTITATANSSNSTLNTTVNPANNTLNATGNSIFKSYTLVPLGTCIINNGIAAYNDILNANNINSTQLRFDDICGIAIAKPNNKHYMMFSMWEDSDIDTNKIKFVDKDYKKNETSDDDKAKCEITTDNVNHVSAKDSAQLKITTDNVNHDVTHDNTICTMADDNTYADIEPCEPTAAEALFDRCEKIDAFCDDIYYDCIEVSPEMLSNIHMPDNISAQNSFLLHGYYSFRHLLFGRVEDNANNTKYFIGVPGMYCNRERYMAFTFGFRSFKRSHRSDYTNPYFGYWITEL